MKKTFILIAVVASLTSCQKEEDCNCGTIANDGIDGDCYWLEVRSDCSGNVKRFCFDQDVWFDNSPGEYFCVTNQSGW